MKYFFYLIYSQKSESKEEKLDTKEIFIQIDKIIRNKYRFVNNFCKETGRNKKSYSNSYNRAISGGSSNLNFVEKLLNDLGYELTIQQKSNEKLREK
nr:MAG TPA: hypothetical protein [Caudoviricetes sp.]